MLRTLVGILTGPLTLSLLSLPPRTKSAHTVSNIPVNTYSNNYKNKTEHSAVQFQIMKHRDNIGSWKYSEVILLAQI